METILHYGTMEMLRGDGQKQLQRGEFRSSVVTNNEIV